MVPYPLGPVSPICWSLRKRWRAWWTRVTQLMLSTLILPRPLAPSTTDFFWWKWRPSLTFWLSLESTRRWRTVMHSGAPQGCVKGPLLFLFFINGLSGVLDALTLLFADDVKTVTRRSRSVNLENSLPAAWDWSNKWDQILLNATISQSGEKFPWDCLFPPMCLAPPYLCTN